MLRRFESLLGTRRLTDFIRKCPNVCTNYSTVNRLTCAADHDIAGTGSISLTKAL